MLKQVYIPVAPELPSLTKYGAPFPVSAAAASESRSVRPRGRKHNSDERGKGKRELTFGLKRPQIKRRRINLIWHNRVIRCIVQKLQRIEWQPSCSQMSLSWSSKVSRSCPRWLERWRKLLQTADICLPRKKWQNAPPS